MIVEAYHTCVRFMNWLCLKGDGYQFWSGMGVTLFTPFWFAVGYYARHVCHIDGCKKIGRIDPEHHWPACKIHHSRYQIK